jgi:dolichol-phosphate mannosyltransferase
MSDRRPGGTAGAEAPPEPGGDLASASAWPPGRVLVVTATFNERGSIADLVDRVLGVDPGLQMLVVDDDSPDGTGELALDLARTRPRLHVLVRRGRRGLGSAIIEGFRLASAHGFAVALNMDADFSHDPDDIPRLLAALEPVGGRPAAVALGSRRVAGGRIVGWPLSRRVTSVVVNWYARWILRLPVRDSSTGFRAVHLAFFDRLPGPFDEGYAVLEDMLIQIHRAGGRLIEVPITFTDRTVGESKAGLRQRRDAALALLRMAIRAWRP